MHGDEPPGMVMLIDLAHYLVENYNQVGYEDVTDLLDTTEITIMPLHNPDGYVADTRYNADGVDLNRNFGWAWVYNPEGFNSSRVGCRPPVDFPNPVSVIRFSSISCCTIAEIDAARIPVFLARSARDNGPSRWIRSKTMEILIRRLSCGLPLSVVLFVMDCVSYS